MIVGEVVGLDQSLGDRGLKTRPTAEVNVDPLVIEEHDVRPHADGGGDVLDAVSVEVADRERAGHAVFGEERQLLRGRGGQPARAAEVNPRGAVGAHHQIAEAVAVEVAEPAACG